MNDFSIVRMELATDIHSDPDEAIAALVRIEADHKRDLQAIIDATNENARLRGALERIAGPPAHTRESFLEGDFTKQYREAQSIARAALSEEESG